MTTNGAARVREGGGVINRVLVTGHVGRLSVDFAVLGKDNKEKKRKVPPPPRMLQPTRRGLDADSYAAQVCTYKSEDSMG